MLTHQIKLKIERKPLPGTVTQIGDQKPKVRHGSENHKRAIAKGSMSWNDWAPGDYVSVSTHPGDSGWVVDVLDMDKFDAIEWDGLKPRFIEVYMDGLQESILFHPADLFLLTKG